MNLFFQILNPKADIRAFTQNAIKVFDALDWKYETQYNGTSLVVKKVGSMPSLRPFMVRLLIKFKSPDWVNIEVRHKRRKTKDSGILLQKDRKRKTIK